MADVPSLQLNDGNAIPQLGFGAYKIADELAADAVGFALETGYRHIDTAAFYENERGVGEGIRRSGLAREDVYVTTKVWWTDNGYDSTLRSFDESLERLRFDYVDLYLIHWPAPKHDLYVDAWRALERLRGEGRAAAPSVSPTSTSTIWSGSHAKARRSLRSIRSSCIRGCSSGMHAPTTPRTAS